jgi:SAM-dependent methyltransferase
LSFLRRWRRKARWWLGRGWTDEDFDERYVSGGADAWGYRGSPRHRQRAEWILEALPADRFATVLEVGCAQGFLTERIAARAERVVACDLSAASVRQAREHCRSLANVEFRVADIRRGFPGDGFDLCLFSDVLYYLSVPETDGVLAEAAVKVASGGFLFIANEWRQGAKGLTPPAYAFAVLDADGRWERHSGSQQALDETTLTIAVYRRRPEATKTSGP